MTAIDALESYCSSHSESFEELLEWPYRRFMKAFDSYQRRSAVDEVENRKNLHVNALHGIVEWKEQGDQQEAIDGVEEYYENLKDFIWNPKKAEEENLEMQELEAGDSFLAAGKRNIEKNFGSVEQPGQIEIEDFIDE